MAVADREVIAGSEVWRSSATMQTGTLAKADTNVSVQAVGDALPVLIVPAKSVELGSIEGEVPQVETDGVVPEETTCPLFWKPMVVVPIGEEMFNK